MGQIAKSAAGISGLQQLAIVFLLIFMALVAVAQAQGSDEHCAQNRSPLHVHTSSVCSYMEERCSASSAFANKHCQRRRLRDPTCIQVCKVASRQGYCITNFKV